MHHFQSQYIFLECRRKRSNQLHNWIYFTRVHLSGDTDMLTLYFTKSFQKHNLKKIFIKVHERINMCTYISDSGQMKHAGQLQYINLKTVNEMNTCIDSHACLCKYMQIVWTFAVTLIFYKSKKRPTIVHRYSLTNAYKIMSHDPSLCFILICT